MEIREVAVVGLGIMGAGIAEIFARTGLRVAAIEVDPGALEHGMATLDRSLGRAVARGKLTEQEKAAVLARVRPAQQLSDAATADLVVEVVPERMDIKRLVFGELDQVCRPEAILATNTSSISITAIAGGTRHPERVAGLHFFNPAQVMRLVEVITTVRTAPAVSEALTELVRRLGKTPVQVADRAGFVVNALLVPYLNHAVRLLETGYATREDIDAAATVGIGLPMGPLTLLDLVGLDTVLSVLDVLYGEFAGPRFAGAPTLRRMVDAGLTGRKAGRGFYDYEKKEPAQQPGPDTIHNDDHAAEPGPVTLVGGGAGPGTRLAELIEAAGWLVAAGPRGDGLVIVHAEEPSTEVLGAALATGRPADAVGLHLAGDKLAELIVTPMSAPGAVEAAAALVGTLGLTVVRCKDRPGFLAGALLCAHLNDAVRMVQDGYASAAGIDTAMMLGCGYPVGPLQLIDQVGPGYVLTVLTEMYRRYGDPAFAPAPLLAEHAAAGLSFR
jgi:3-hydroxybutyryl-CoA dehydrogenase